MSVQFDEFWQYVHTYVLHPFPIRCSLPSQAPLSLPHY